MHAHLKARGSHIYVHHLFILVFKGFLIESRTEWLAREPLGLTYFQLSISRALGLETYAPCLPHT